MDNVIEFPTPSIGDASRGCGGCPEGDSLDGYLNIGRCHWAFCDKHKTKWCFGENLFSGWREESQEDHVENERHLASFKEIKPIGLPDNGEVNVSDKLKQSMRTHWGKGLRSAEFHKAVRADCPAATLEEFNAAADEVWEDV